MALAVLCSLLSKRVSKANEWTQLHPDRGGTGSGCTAAPTSWLADTSIKGLIVSDELPEVILARIDERTKALQGDVQKIQAKLESSYVTNEAFDNLREKVTLHQKIILSISAIICTSVLAALVSLVLGRGVV